jgi:hypothetical protein
MMRARYQFGMLAVVALLTPAPSYAIDVIDITHCSQLKNVARQDTYRVKPTIINKCMKNGWAPPISWRSYGGKNAGIKVGGAGGFAFTTVRAPDLPPGKLNSGKSVSDWMYNFSFKIPPWGNSSGDNEDNDGDGQPDNDSSSCKMAQDTSGDLGEKQTISGSGTVTLPCGGALPLASYQLSLSPGATHLFATEAGYYNYWTYQRSGTNFNQISAQNVKLPTYLCSKNSKGKMVKSVTLRPAIAQMIAYTASSGSIAVRLQPPAGDLPPDPFDPDPDLPQERYLIIPVAGGMPQVPGNCALESTYYKPITSAANSAITIQGEGGISGGGGSGGGSTGTSCDVAVLNPTAPGPNGTDACQDTTLIAAIDKPVLVYPPATSAQTMQITGRTAVMAATVQGSSIYATYDSIVYFGAGGSGFTLPEGGTMLLSNGQLLMMNGPATINANQHTVTLTNGGNIQSNTGILLQILAPGSSFSPPASLPYAVRLGHNVDMPAGYLVPTQANPYVQLPIAPEPETP